MTTEGVQDVSEINIDEWLQSSKIGADAAKIIKEKELTLESLLALNKDELKQFGTDVLGLDMLSKYRFIQSVQQLKRHHAPNTKSVTRTIIVSSEEHEAMSTLYQQYHKSSLTIKDIHDAINKLNNIEHEDINDAIDTITNQIGKRKMTLLNNIDEIQQHKLNILSQQMTEIENYLKTISNTKLKYEQYTKDHSMHPEQRKELVLNMVQNVMSSTTMTSTLATTPNICFDVEKHLKSLKETLFDHMVICDCDQPFKMDLKLKKISFGGIYVEYVLNEYDIHSAKKILDIALEYAVIPKKYTNDASRDDTYDSDKNLSVDDSDASSGEQVVRKAELDINDISDHDMEKLKWSTNKKKLKYHKKHRRKNKYKIEDIRPFRGYLIRIKAQNESGWSPYSNILSVVTKECVKILKFSEEHRSGDGLIISHHRRVVKRMSTGHKYILADTKEVFKGRHCWRVKIKNNKHWLFFGVSEKKTFTDNNYSNSYGCSGANQYYNNSNSAVTNNKVNTKHLHSAKYVDMLLDCDKGKLRICEVGNCIDAKEVIFQGLPRSHGYVPSFNIHGQAIEIQLAKIAVSWYGKRKSIKFL